MEVTPRQRELLRAIGSRGEIPALIRSFGADVDAELTSLIGAMFVEAHVPPGSPARPYYRLTERGRSEAGIA